MQCFYRCFAGCSQSSLVAYFFGLGNLLWFCLFPRPVLVCISIFGWKENVTDWCDNKHPEPEFVNLLRSPGIDSQPGGPMRQPYLTYRPASLHRLAESIPWNPFVGSLNVSKFGLSCSVKKNIYLILTRNRLKEADYTETLQSVLSTLKFIL